MRTSCWLKVYTQKMTTRQTLPKLLTTQAQALPVHSLQAGVVVVASEWCNPFPFQMGRCGAAIGVRKSLFRCQRQGT